MPPPVCRMTAVNGDLYRPEDAAAGQSVGRKRVSIHPSRILGAGCERDIGPAQFMLTREPDGAAVASLLIIVLLQSPHLGRLQDRRRCSTSTGSVCLTGMEEA
jgi:hypothetical protein